MVVDPLWLTYYTRLPYGCQQIGIHPAQTWGLPREEALILGFLQARPQNDASPDLTSHAHSL